MSPDQILRTITLDEKIVIAHYSLVTLNERLYLIF